VRTYFHDDVPKSITANHRHHYSSANIYPVANAQLESDSTHHTSGKQQNLVGYE
jgi:hypothetical protein